MNHFEYRNGVLHAEDVPLPEIAAAVGTPAGRSASLRIFTLTSFDTPGSCIVTP